LLGEARFFTGSKQRIWNGTVHAEDGFSEEDSRTEMIVTITTWMGDVEVIRR